MKKLVLSFSALSAVLLLSLLFMSFNDDPPRKYKVPPSVKHIRYNVYSDSGQAHLKILQEGLAKMKTMSCDQPFSWYFQGGIHGAPPKGSNDLCDEHFSDKKGWNNCTHHGAAANATMHFLSWHKIYLEHFENAVREVTGKPHFTVPYWEYDARDNKNRTMPPPLQDKNSSLYEICRNQKMNQGEIIPPKINYFGRNVDATSTEDIFPTKPDTKGFSRFIDFTGAAGGLESTPHNRMHVYLGTDPEQDENRITHNDKYKGWGLMYDPASAGMDPVFWIHHSNIDRLFSKWLIVKVDDALAVRPTFEDFQKLTWDYRFYPTNDLNAMKTYSLEEAYQTAFGINDYTYQSFIEDNSYTQDYINKTRTAIKEQLQPSRGLLAAAPPLQLSIGSHHAPNLMANKNNIAIANIQIDAEPSGFQRLAKQKEFFIMEVEIEFTEAPEGFFQVDIQQGNKIETAGVMTFFGVGHRHGNMMSHGHNQATEKTFTFDITDEIDLSMLPETVKVMVKKIGEIGSEDMITIDRIAIHKHVVMN